MSAEAPSFVRVIAALEERYGTPPRPPTVDPFELIVWENCAYLVDDERRSRTFASLRERVGTSPAALLTAPADVLVAAIRDGGMRAPQRADRLVACAELVAERFDGDLAPVLALPLPKARRELQRFPGIGAPGAEKVLLLCGAHAVLSLDSNGLRVLVRLGFAPEGKSYPATYAAIRAALAPQLPAGVADLTRAHLLLRAHGKELCKNTSPLCELCPLTGVCAFPA